MTHWTVDALDRVNCDRVTHCNSGEISVIETSVEGAGTVFFRSKNEMLRFQGYSQPPVKWSKCLKCADGSVIVLKDESTELFLIELKSSLSISEFRKACEQFYGGYVNSLAISGVLGLRSFSKVQCIISYKTEKISELFVANPSLLKAGNELKGTGVAEWISKKVHIPTLGECVLVENIRDDKTGNGSVVLDET